MAGVIASARASFSGFLMDTTPGLAVLARNHHDLPTLLADFDREVEIAIANYRTANLKEELLDKARSELEVMRYYLREVVEKRQPQQRT